MTSGNITTDFKPYADAYKRLAQITSPRRPKKTTRPLWSDFRALDVVLLVDVITAIRPGIVQPIVQWLLSLLGSADREMVHMKLESLAETYRSAAASAGSASDGED